MEVATILSTANEEFLHQDKNQKDTWNQPESPSKPGVVKYISFTAMNNVWNLDLDMEKSKFYLRYFYIQSRLTSVIVWENQFQTHLVQVGTYKTKFQSNCTVFSCQCQLQAFFILFQFLLSQYSSLFRVSKFPQPYCRSLINVSKSYYYYELIF